MEFNKNPPSSLHHQAIWVSLGKIVSSLLSMVLPMYLARTMGVEKYGIYKQVFLIWPMALQLFSLGIDHGLFYFIGKSPKKSPYYSLNVIIFNLISTSIILLILSLVINPISSLIQNPDLPNLWWPLCLLLLASLPGQHLEHYFMLLGKIRFNLFFQIFTEMIKSLVIIVTYHLSHDLYYVLLALASFYFIRPLFLLFYNISAIKKGLLKINLKEQYQDFKEQYLFGLPMGLSKFSLVLMGLDKFIISSLMGLKSFTFYAVGSMDLPLIPGVLYTYVDNMGIEMMKARNDLNLMVKIWHQYFIRIFFIIFTPIIFLEYFAGDFILFFYGNEFLDATNLLRIGLLSFLFSAFDCEIIFRVFNQNKKMAKIYIFYVVTTLLLVLISAKSGNLFLPLMAKAITSLTYLIAVFNQYGRFLNLNLKEFIPWNKIIRPLISMLLSGFISYVLSVQETMISLPSFLRLFGAGSIYLILNTWMIGPQKIKEFFSSAGHH